MTSSVEEYEGRHPAATLVDPGSRPTREVVPELQVEGPGAYSPRPPSLNGRRPGLTRTLIAVDLVALTMAAIVHREHIWSALTVAAVIMVLNAASGGYAARLTLSALDDAPHVLGRALAGGAVAGIAQLFVLGNGIRVSLTTAAVYGFLALIGRAVLYWQVRRLRASGAIAHPTLIVGAGRVGALVAETLLDDPSHGMRPVGFVDDDPLLGGSSLRAPLLGGTDDLASLLEEHHISNVVVAFSTVNEPQLVDVVRTCDRLACEIFFVPRLYEIYGPGRDVDSIGSLPIVRMRRAPFRSFSWRLKRLGDIIGSLLALVLLLPLFPACALATWISIGGPVLYRQHRVGLDGRKIVVLKFRTLADADPEEGNSQWTIADDERLRPVGRFLRRTSLDELPQLWNVLRGDMSLVGPRPERPHFVSEFAARYPRYMARHRVPCGITGWAQVNGLRGDTSIEARVQYDNFYIENWSLWGDMKILLRTFKQVVKGAGA